MTVTLAAAMGEIMDGIVSALAEQNTTTGILADVKVIARGDRQEPRPENPAIWIFARQANPGERTIGSNFTEMFEMPVVLAAMVQDDDDDCSGYDAATDLAARARGVVLTSAPKRFGLDYVTRVISGAFEPSAPWHKAGPLFRSFAEIRVQFQVRG